MRKENFPFSQCASLRHFLFGQLATFFCGGASLADDRKEEGKREGRKEGSQFLLKPDTNDITKVKEISRARRRRLNLQ